MSKVSVRAALETALAAMSPSVDTEFENVPYTPVPNTPYQQAFVMFAEPNNPIMGNSFKQEQGIFQVTLRYPSQVGSGAANARADLIAATFHRGATFTAGGITVTVERTPAIGNGVVDGDRWAVPVKVRFYSNISLG